MTGVLGTSASLTHYRLHLQLQILDHIFKDAIITSAGPSQRGLTAVDRQNGRELDSIMPHRPGRLAEGLQSMGTDNQNGIPLPATNHRQHNNGHQGSVPPQWPRYVPRWARPTPRSRWYRFGLWYARRTCGELVMLLILIMLPFTSIGVAVQYGDSWSRPTDSSDRSGREASSVTSAIAIGAPTTSHERQKAEAFVRSRHQQDIQSVDFAVYAAPESRVKLRFRNRQTQAVFSPAPQIYPEPMPAPTTHWTLMTQQSSPSDSSVTTVENSNIQEDVQDLATASKKRRPTVSATCSEDSRKMNAAQEDSFDHWGVKLLYSLRHRSLQSMQIEKQWCLEHACSEDGKDEENLCINGTKVLKESEKKTCEWCWDNTTLTTPNVAKLDHHCNEVAKRSLIFLSIICGMLLLSILTIMALLALQRIKHMRKHMMTRKHDDLASSEPSQAGAAIAHKGPSNDTAGRTPKRMKLQKKSSHRLEPSDEKKPSISGAQIDKVLVMPRAIPYAIDEQVFADIHTMGHGRLLQDSNSQEDALGLSRTSSRRERVISSGSEPTPLRGVYRKPA
ncbi:hypothetical protein N7G274_004659 [Stereocaulon virgatum]|uniref:Uncharacterized protein n=1 Tax=Stereocaulon virgatum TaxID=373712 RepID=A0ABR4AAJ5_9LECA